MNKVNQSVKKGDLVDFADLFAGYSKNRQQEIVKRARDIVAKQKNRQRVRIPL